MSPITTIIMSFIIITIIIQTCDTHETQFC